MTLILLAIGLFFLLLSFTGLMFPFFFFLIPVIFLFRKPSVKVYTRTFDMNDFNQGQNPAAGPKKLDSVIDVESTEVHSNQIH